MRTVQIDDPSYRFAPMMTPFEVALLEQLLLALSEPVSVLEWGSGNSTIHFARLLHEKGRHYSWDAIESNSRWGYYVQHILRNNGVVHANVHLVDFGGINPKKQSLPDTVRDQYVGQISDLGNNFNLVIVDGRFRRRCLASARLRQSPGSVVFLHDAERPHYLCGETDSPTGLLLDTGFHPYSRAKSHKKAWLGFATTAEMSMFQNNQLTKLDLSAFLQQTEQLHKQYQRPLTKWRLKLRTWWIRTHTK